MEAVAVAAAASEEKKTKSPIHKWIEKMAVHLHNEENKRLVQLYVVDPILNHVMDRVFPYIILTCALFSLLVILVGLTFVILLLKVSPRSVPIAPLNLPDIG